MIYEVNIRVVADLPQALEGPEMVAQVWASGLVEGIKHNRPEVVGVEVDVQRLEQEFAREVRELENDPQAQRTDPQRELGSGETSD